MKAVTQHTKDLEDKLLLRDDNLREKVTGKVKTYIRELSHQMNSLKSDIHAEEKEYWPSQVEQWKEFRTQDIEVLVKLSVKHTMRRKLSNLPSALPYLSNQVPNPPQEPRQVLPPRPESSISISSPA